MRTYSTNATRPVVLDHLDPREPFRYHLMHPAQPGLLCIPSAFDEADQLYLRRRLLPPAGFGILLSLPVLPNVLDLLLLLEPHPSDYTVELRLQLPTLIALTATTN